MKLADYLAATSTSHSAFGVRIGVSQATVSRYVSGARIPGAKAMAKIAVATGGAVLPNDFYETPDGARAGFAESGAPVEGDQTVQRITVKPMTPEREAAWARWREENAEATRSYNEHIEKHGIFGEKWRRW